MGENQHFVPQFYLRNFGRGDSIAVYNMARQAHVPVASIKGQCKRSYLYGRDGALESALSVLEGRSAEILRKMMADGEAPLHFTVEHRDLLHFLVFQWARTPAAGRHAEAMHTRATRALLKSHPEATPEIREGLDDLEWRSSNPVMLALSQMAKMAPVLADLESKILVSPPGAPQFVTSDSPVVFYNQWAIGVRGRGTTGLACSGLQVFLPLSPRHTLLLFDGGVYKVGHANDTSVTLSSRDVQNVNSLQLLVAEENLYYSGDQGTRVAIGALPFEHRRQREEAPIAKRAEAIDGSPSTLIHLYDEPPELGSSPGTHSRPTAGG